MRRVLLALGVMTCGCASYGWADRAGEHTVTRPIVVRTIDIDAHAGADAAALTRELVRELHRAGVRTATWTGANQRRDVVECDIALERDEGFGDTAFVAVSTACRVDGTLVTTHTADAQLALTATDRRLGRRRAAESAARLSFPAVAIDLAGYLER